MSHELTYSFSIDKREISRRITAFTVLIVSLFLGLIVWSIVLFPRFVSHYFWFGAIFLLLFLSVFIIFRILIVRFFHSFLKTKVYLNDQTLERVTTKSHDTFLLKNMTKISIINTTQGKIRDVVIWFTDGKNLTLDGLENFEQFKNKLIDFAKQADIQETHERIDYDNFLFYPILGIIVSFWTVLAMKLLINLDSKHMQFIALGLVAYVFILGSYFVFKQPLTKRYGNKLLKADYICGFLMITAATAISLLIFI